MTKIVIELSLPGHYFVSLRFKLTNIFIKTLSFRERQCTLNVSYLCIYQKWLVELISKKARHMKNYNSVQNTILCPKHIRRGGF